MSASAVAPSPPPHTITDIDACRGQCGARGAVRSRCGWRGGQTERWRCKRTPCKHAWEYNVCPLSPLAAPASAAKRPQRTSLAPKSTRGACEGVPAGSRRLPAGAPFAKRRSPPGRAGNAMFRPHYLMRQWHALTKIWLVQKQCNYLCQSAKWL